MTRPGLPLTWIPVSILFWACGLSPVFATSDGAAAVLPILCVGGVICGIIVFFMGFKQLRKKRMIEDIPTSTIRAMAPGQVEITGRAVDWNRKEGPFTRHPCVYFDLLVEQYVRSGKHSHWQTVFKENTAEYAFCLQDETGTVLVVPKGAEIVISESYSLTTGLFTDIPAHVEQYLSMRNFSCHGFLGFEKTLRFTEKNLKLREMVYALGVCQAYGGKFPDAPAGAVENVCLAKGERPGDLFILSDKSQKQLVGSYGWKAFFGVFGGVALIAVSLYFLLFLLRLIKDAVF